MKQTLKLAVGAAVIIGMGALSLSAEGKVKVCHREGNGKAHVIDISENALKAHLAHGDSVEGIEGKKPGESCQLAPPPNEPPVVSTPIVPPPDVPPPGVILK